MSVVSKAALAAAALAALGLSHTASAACYQVYAADGSVLYRDVTPPIDMSRPIHENLSKVAPGAKLIFTPAEDNCQVPINKLPMAGAAPKARPRRADRG